MKGKKWLSILTICFVMILSCGLLSACGSNICLKINFDSNGGTECSSIEYVVGKSFNMPNDPTKDGYVFDGWYEDEDAWEKPFTTNTVLNYPLSKNMEITVYAKWLPRLNITFDSNGGTECVSMVYDNSTSLPTPIREKYSFVGWYLDFGTWQQPFSNDVLIDKEPDSNIVLYARWSLDRYIIFESNEGSACDPVLFVANEEINLPTPKKTLYVFKGWFMDKELTVPFDKSLIHFDTFETGIKVYAKWEEKIVEHIEFFGEPKTEYLYGEELDLQGMYAVIDYYYYTSEIVYITEDMVSGFDTKRISLDTTVKELQGTMSIKIGNEYKYFVYSVKPKYQSIVIKEGTIKTTYLFGENASQFIRNCDGNYMRNHYTTGLTGTIIATKYDDTQEEFEIVIKTDDSIFVKTECSHSFSEHNMDMNWITDFVFVTQLLGYPSIYKDTESVETNVFVVSKNGVYKSNSYCTLSTNKAGDAVGILYFGLLSTTFEYTVNEPEANIQDFEQSDYNFIKELDKEIKDNYNPNITYNRSIIDEKLTITLENGRKFEWKIDEEHNIIADFQFERSGEFMALIRYPYSSNDMDLLQIKYTIISLNDIDYIDYGIDLRLTEDGCDLDSIPSTSTIYYTINNEQKTMHGRYYWFGDNKPHLDLSKPGQHEITVVIKNIEVPIKYIVVDENANNDSQGTSESHKDENGNYHYDSNSPSNLGEGSQFAGGQVGNVEDSDTNGVIKDFSDPSLKDTGAT